MNNIVLKDNKATHVSVITYPDGQHNIKLDVEYFSYKYPVLITCRIKTFSELEVLLSIVAALKKYDYIIKNINFIYLFGQRSDRAFELGQPNYYRDVLLPIIKSMRVPYVLYVPHNDKYNKEGRENVPEGFINIGGDESTKTHFNDVYLSFIKTRDVSGNIKLHLPIEVRDKLRVSPYQGIQVVDDLCDGGATFIEAGKLLKEFPNKKHLYIIHGLFSKGIDELLQYYDTITTTNSYRDLKSTERLKVIEVI